MDDSSKLFAEIHELLSGQFEGRPDADAEARLQALLENDPEARQVYLEYIVQTASLRWWAGAATKGQTPLLEEQRDALQAEETSSPSTGEWASKILRMPSSPRPAEPRESAPAWEQPRKLAAKSRRRFWYGFAAALFIGVTLATVELRHQGATPLATLGATVGVEWDTPNGSPASGAGLPDGLLELKAGVAEVKFRSGASMIVEGPARFRILDSNAASLALGKLTATVPPEAHGFSVQTSVSRIVDLGTEFGVEMRNDHSMRADVFRGRVEMHAIAGPPDAAPTMLTANHAVEISTGGLATVPAAPHPERFVRAISGQASLPAADGPNYERWLAFSRELRQDPTLVLYYTLEDTAPAAAPTVLSNRAVETAGQFDVALADANAPMLTAGRWAERGIAMDFDPAKKQRLLLQNYPPAKDGVITVVAWVYARSRPTYGNIVNNWWFQKTGQFHLGLNINEGDLWLRAVQLHGPDLFAREGKLFPTGRWCQVACTADEKMVRLYRDGVEVAALPSPGLTGQPVATTLGIGFKPGDNGRDPSPGPDSGFWDGKIDELAIFHRALSPEEIRTSYEAGKVTP